MRIIFNGAEPIAADLCREFVAALAPARLASNVMFPVYGLAEASLAVTFPEAGRAAPRRERLRAPRWALATPCAPYRRATKTPSSSCGSAAPCRTARFASPTSKAPPSPRDTVGRILIRGANVSPGYYDDAALTQASRTADGFLDTGDLGAMVDGELVVTGRVKEILFVAGQNHYPQDIDLVLAQHAGIELGRAAAAGTRRDRTRRPTTCSCSC